MRKGTGGLRKGTGNVSKGTEGLKGDRRHGKGHSWAQRKLSPLNLLNILLTINGPLLSLGFNSFND